MAAANGGRHAHAINAILAIPSSPSDEAVSEVIAQQVRIWLACDFGIRSLARWNQEDGPKRLASGLALGAGNAAYETRVWAEPPTSLQTDDLAFYLASHVCGRVLPDLMGRLCMTVTATDNAVDWARFQADIQQLSILVAQAVMSPQFSLAQVSARDKRCRYIEVTAAVVTILGVVGLIVGVSLT